MSVRFTFVIRFVRNVRKRFPSSCRKSSARRASPPAKREPKTASASSSTKTFTMRSEVARVVLEVGVVDDRDLAVASASAVRTAAPLPPFRSCRRKTHSIFAVPRRGPSSSTPVLDAAPSARQAMPRSRGEGAQDLGGARRCEQSSTTTTWIALEVRASSRAPRAARARSRRGAARCRPGRGRRGTSSADRTLSEGRRGRRRGRAPGRRGEGRSPVPATPPARRPARCSRSASSRSDSIMSRTSSSNDRARLPAELLRAPSTASPRRKSTSVGR